MISAMEALKLSTIIHKMSLSKTLYIINKTIKNEAKRGKVYTFVEVESSILSEVKDKLINKGYRITATLIAAHDKSKYLIVIRWGE